MHMRIHISRNQIPAFAVNDFRCRFSRCVLRSAYADDITVKDIHFCRINLTGEYIDELDVCHGFVAGEFSHGNFDQVQLFFFCLHGCLSFLY